MTRKTLTLIAALALALSGCLGAHEDDDPLDDQGTHDPPEPLHANLDANQTTGPSPLTVAFTLNASSTDDPLNWSLHPGDGTTPFTGRTLPSTIEHTYPDPGAYTVRLAIDTGERTDDATITLTVETPSGPNGANGDEEDDASDEGEGPSDSYDGPDPVTITGNAALGNPLHASFCFNQGVDGDTHEISPAQPGWAYQLEPPQVFAIYWYAGDEYIEQGDDAGTVPPGADTVEICLTEDGGDVTEYELTLHDPAHPNAS